MTWTHTYTWTLEATPVEVFGALTDAAALRAWFAEHAEVTPKLGGAYRFWGRHTLGAPNTSEAQQKLTAFTPSTALAFDWRIMGIQTTVDLTFAPDPKGTPGTKVSLKHEVRGELPVPRQREMIDDHWRFQFGNLAAHLVGGAGVVRPDFTDPAPQVRMSVLIDAPRATVFRTMMDPALVNQWFSAKAARVDPVQGGEYRLGWEYKIDGRDVVGGTTRILELVPGEKLVLDWLEWRGDTSVPPQFISFTLEDEGSGTRVNFVHGGFTRTADLSDYPWGWAYFVGELQKVAMARLA